ncbi:MAG: ATP-grasp domain-containing protein [Clostridia bacterium]|nr:ATP-grasp domain-containing protein [Clostridia bacterium]
MTKVAIIGANDFQNPLILEANRRGYETHVFAWRANAIGEKTARFFHPVSITEKEEILEICRSTGIQAVCSIGSDLAAITVNYVANHLGLPSNPPETAVIATNKYEMRKAFRVAGLSVPAFAKAGASISESELSEILSSFSLPLIIKPTDRSGSRGIQKITVPDPVLLRNAIEEACRQSFEHAAIIESFIDGQEFSCECISHEGRHTMLAVTRKYTTGAPHYIETGHIEPAGLPASTLERIQNAVFSGLDALHVTCGASHSEFKIDPFTGEIRLIEIGARMGGDCIGSDLVPLSTGVDFVGQVLDTALGQAPAFPDKAQPGAAAIRFIFSDSDLMFMKHLQAQHPELFYRTSDIMSGTAAVTDSSTRHGFYILKADSRDTLLRLSGLEQSS